jgi:transposase
LALVFGEESMLPVYYRKMPGNISDVSTIKKLLIDMDFLGLEKINFVLDRGFYSADNINSLYRMRHKFVIAGRANSALIKTSIGEMLEKIKDFSNYNTEHNIYCITKESRWKYEYQNKKGEKSSENRLLYIHVYYDGIRAESEKIEFIKKLKIVEEAFIDGSCSDAQKTLFDKYFILKENSSIVSFAHNQEEINSHMQNFGYFALLSNHITDAKTAISIYRNKDVVEKTFCNLKNRLDMKRTKVSTEESLEGKIFIQFIALIYISFIHQVMSDNNLYKNYSMASLLDEIDVIEIFEYNGKKTHFSEITKKQHDILQCFDIVL